MKTLFDYDPGTGVITGSNGFVVTMFGMVGFEPETAASDRSTIVDLVKLGVSPDDIIKLKNHNLL